MAQLHEEGELKNFVKHFFGNLKCTLREEGEELIIENVPKEFEKFYGTQGPYFLVFDGSLVREGVEHITKTSFLLKTMNSYLDNRGQTTLLKLDFPIDFKVEVPKRLPLHNCEIATISKKHVYGEILRFTFQTTFMYLNEKEVLLHSIFLEDGKVIEFDLSKYTAVEGKKEDIIIDAVGKEYEQAKLKLKELIQPRINQVSGDLKEQLDKELIRISAHFDQQIKEIDEDFTKTKTQIDEITKQLEKAADKKIDALKAKLIRLQEHLDTSDLENKREKLVKERTFFESDEAKKYGLTISNKLLNMTIIYYPIFLPTLFFKTKDGTGRHLEMQLHPITNELSKVFCDSCKKEISEIILCSSGHLTCNACGDRCDECRGIVCASCIRKSCGMCGKKVCKKCYAQCSTCGKFFCSSHRQKNNITGKEGCVQCLSVCSLCNKWTDISHFKQCSKCGRSVCERCIRPDFLNNGGKLFCDGCRKKGL